MRDTYLDYETRTIANLIPKSSFDNPDLQGWIISRINVPSLARGHGHGSKMLRRILADADQEGETLYLDILPSGPLDYSDLKAWYERHGFRERPSGEYKRIPRHDKPYAPYRYKDVAMPLTSEPPSEPPSEPLFISEHVKEAIKQISEYNMTDTPPTPSCTHINLTVMSITEWVRVGDVEEDPPKIYQCDDCEARYLVTPHRTLTPADLKPSSVTEATYFKSEVQQAIEVLLKIAQDSNEDALDRLEVAKYIIDKGLGAN